MKNSDRGQTVIETALMIILLFVLFFGIAEVARFWWLKNQVNNAARVGVRVAIVDPSLNAAEDNDIGTCNGGVNCSTTTILSAACCSMTNGALSASTVHLKVEANEDGSFIPGGIVTVTVTSPRVLSVVQGLASWPILGGLIPNNIRLSSSSTMRHE